MTDDRFKSRKQRIRFDKQRKGKLTLKPRKQEVKKDAKRKAA